MREWWKSLAHPVVKNALKMERKSFFALLYRAKVKKKIFAAEKLFVHEFPHRFSRTQKWLTFCICKVLNTRVWTQPGSWCTHFSLASTPGSDLFRHRQDDSYLRCWAAGRFYHSISWKGSLDYHNPFLQGFRTLSPSFSATVCPISQVIVSEQSFWSLLLLHVLFSCN